MKNIMPAILALFSLSFNTNASECGSVTIADMNWNSATLIANVDRFILEHGYGCDAELIPGDTMPTGTSMVEKGQPDVAPELWSNGLKKALDRGVQEKRLRYAGKVLTEGGEEGFWVPKYLTQKYPELKTIEGIKKHAKLFTHPEDKTKSAFYSCPAGWTCQITAGNLFAALNLKDAGFDVIDTGSGAGLSGSIAKAYARKEPWFGYYWAPTAVLGKYEMVKVDFGSGIDKKEYFNCISKEGCKSPKPTMYPPSAVHTITTEDFAKNSPKAYRYFTKRGFTNSQLNSLLAWMEDNQAVGEDAMYHFLENYPQIWTAWVPADVAKKVKKAL